MHREVALRIASCMVRHEFRLLKEKGMLSWPAYKKNRPCIVGALATLNDALRRYKQRSLRDGYFYLV